VCSKARIGIGGYHHGRMVLAATTTAALVLATTNGRYGTARVEAIPVQIHLVECHCSHQITLIGTTYGFSKAVVHALTRIYARDIAQHVKDPTDITVNAICPGWYAPMHTYPSAQQWLRMHAHSFADMDDVRLSLLLYPLLLI